MPRIFGAFLIKESYMKDFIYNLDISELPDNTLSVLVPAVAIKDGSTVRKKTGQKEYIVKRNIKIYNTDKMEIKCEADSVFLVDDRGNISMISSDTVLLLEVEIEYLLRDLEYGLEEDK